LSVGHLLHSDILFIWFNMWSKLQSHQTYWIVCWMLYRGSSALHFVALIYFDLISTCSLSVYMVSEEAFLSKLFVHKRLRIFNRFFTHLLQVPIYARLQIFIQLSAILTKLCHIKRDCPVHIICSKCSPSAETRALTRLLKSLIALLIVVCGK